MNWKLLEELCNTPGVSGHERAVAEIFKRETASIAKEAWFDNVGNFIVHVGGEGPKIALDAHTDEVGFIVNYVDDEGFIRVTPLGGIDPRVFYAQRVIVHGTEDLKGVVGAVPPHLLDSSADRDKAVPIENAFIDLGLPSDVVNKKVKIGDIVTFDSKLEDLGEAFIGKAFDDRLGLFVIIEAIKKAKKIACDLYLVAAVQEERGLRGAGCAAFTIKPDIAIALEGTVANDLPGVPPHKRLATQDKGAELRITDRALIADRALVDYLAQIAEDNGIACQLVVKNAGTTNATSIETSAGGVRVAAISAPVRYIHSPIGLVKKHDIECQINLLAKYLETADKTPPRR